MEDVEVFSFILELILSPFQLVSFAVVMRTTGLNTLDMLAVRDSMFSWVITRLSSVAWGR